MALRVLALHGFGQTASVFMTKRIKELAHKLRAVLAINALDAPYTLPYDESLRGWWTYPPDVWDGRAETIQALAETLMKGDEVEVVGLAESLSLVLKEWASGNYDGIFGFSQGAVLAAAMCAELHRQGIADRCPSGLWQTNATWDVSASSSSIAYTDAAHLGRGRRPHSWLVEREVVDVLRITQDTYARWWAFRSAEGC